MIYPDGFETIPIVWARNSIPEAVTVSENVSREALKVLGFIILGLRPFAESKPTTTAKVPSTNAKKKHDSGVARIYDMMGNIHLLNSIRNIWNLEANIWAISQNRMIFWIHVSVSFCGINDVHNIQHTKSTLTHRITSVDGMLQNSRRRTWEQEAPQIHRQIRTFLPWKLHSVGEKSQVSMFASNPEREHWKPWNDRETSPCSHPGFTLVAIFLGVTIIKFKCVAQMLDD